MKSTVHVGFDFYVMYLLFHVCFCVALVNIYGAPHRNSSNKEMGDIHCLGFVIKGASYLQHEF